MDQVRIIQPDTYPKMDDLQKLYFAFLLLIKNEQRASGILSCGIYYDDLIQVKSLCDDQVCMILI